MKSTAIKPMSLYPKQKMFNYCHGRKLVKKKKNGGDVRPIFAR